jgi:hypothetical protein
LDDSLVEFVAGHAHTAAEDDTCEGNKGDFGCSAADVDDHVAGGLLNGEPDADSRGHRFFNEINFARPGVRSGIFDRALFHFRDPGRDGDDHPGTHHAATAVRFADQMGQHSLGNFEVGDDTVFERTDGDDVAGRAAEHAFGLIADGENLVRAGLHGDHGGFAQHNALIAHIDQGVGRSKIDPDVTRE